MVRTRDTSQRTLLGVLASMALETGQDVLLVPSVSWLRSRTGMDWHTVENTLDWLDASGRVGVTYNPDRTIWITLRR